MMVAARSTLMPEQLRHAVERLLSDERFRRNAARLRLELANCSGPSLAADLVEDLTQRHSQWSLDARGQEEVA